MSSDINPLSTDNPIFPGEVFANTADFDKGMRQLLPRYDEMLDVLVRCIANTNQRILELEGTTLTEIRAKIGNSIPHGYSISHYPLATRFE